MTAPDSPLATPEFVERARAAARRARDFCAGSGHDLGVAMIDEAWFGGDPSEVIGALSAYQNPDGGLGRNLEVDIASPASNAFAGRLGMHVLLGLKTRPASDLEDRLAAWFAENQAEDGDWHFSEETRSGQLAPWFASWEFPSLNPACCVAGLAYRLAFATPVMLERVARLFAKEASIEDASCGDFYTLLPYAEYAVAIETPDRDAWIDRIAGAIVANEANDRYADPQHFLEHAMGSGNLLLDRIPEERVTANVLAMLDQQTEDGGWPSPYSDAWRPWITASSCVMLSTLIARSS